MKNHLFIGLGGQGGKSIAELRKVIQQREDDAQSLEKRGIKFDFLYIDSSNDVTKNRENWTHFGKSLKLNPDSFLHLDGGLGMNPDILKLKPDIAPWIGDVVILKKFLAGAQGIQGANQRRRFGRLLFACNANKIRRAVCDSKIDPMLKNGYQCAIHIFASLAGGTGSGCIVDLVTMLRTKYPDASLNKGFPIFLYLYATSEDNANSNVGYFHQNQYSTIRDLNALACDRLKPHLLGDEHGGKLFTGDEPVKQILLSTSLNNNNTSLDLSEQHKIFAEAAFERVFAYCSENLGEDPQKSLSGEDQLSGHPGEPLANLQRSFRFGSIGMRRWEVPTEEVTELLANEVYASCFTRILYQNWDSQLGSVAKKLPRTQSAFGSLTEILASKIEEQLTNKSSIPSLEQALEEDFINAHKGIRNTRFKEFDLDGYEAYLKSRYQDDIFENGVDTFFRNLADKRGSRLNKLLESIKYNAVQAWTKADHPIGLSYISDALIELQDLMRKKLGTWASPDVKDSDKALRIKMEKRKLEWTKLTAFSIPFRRDALANAQRLDLINLLKSDLKHRALSEDIEILSLLIKNLGDLISEYQQATEKIESWNTKVSDRRDLLLKDLSDRNQLSSNRYEISDADMVKFIKIQRIEEAALMNATDALLNKTIKRRIESRGIESLGRITPDEEVEYWQEADKEIYNKTRLLHNSIVQRNGIQPILSGDLMETLRKRYLTDPEGFRNELRSFIDSATCSAKLRTEEDDFSPKVLRGDPRMPDMPVKALIVGLPKGHVFAESLKKEIAPLMPPGDSTTYWFYEHGDSTQIRLLSVVSFMAARYMQVVKDLEKMYKDAISSNSGYDAVYFPNIDIGGEKNQRPNLLLPSPEGIRTAMRAAIWLGLRIKLPNDKGCLIQVAGDRVVLLRQDEGGITTMFLGVSISAVEDDADIRTIYRVVDEVSAMLASQTTEQIEKLSTGIAEVDGALRDNLGLASAEYEKWSKVHKKINEMLNS